MRAGKRGDSGMAIAIDASQEAAFSPDRLSGTTRSNVIDRWIYVFTAASFIAIVLTGFIPDSFDKIAAIRAGALPPFPPIMHIHAVIMGSFLLLLLGQTLLVATGKRGWHMQLGVAAMILVPAIVVTGLVLVPTVYHNVWNAAQTAPAPAKQQLLAVTHLLENIMLAQIRIGLLFSIFMWIALQARTSNPGLHKRMIFLAIAAALPPAIDRMHWLPTTFPHSFLATDTYMVLAFSPMLIWDLVRNRGRHRAYVIWAAVFFPVSAALYTLWDTPRWHDIARHIMGV
jgi:hypothetical protein